MEGDRAGGKERRFRPPHPVDLGLTLAPLCRGRRDPTMALGPGWAWRATRTPLGPATLHLRAEGDAIVARAWGKGAAWALDQAPALVGCRDDDRGFAPAHPLVAELHHRFPGLRIPCTGRVIEAVLPTVCEQKVTTVEAGSSWRALVRATSGPAPGPAGRGEA
ncbi:MAG: DNA-3-methyladenine glycosylase 2 family protein, partial [Acidimicrobiales bacterium]